MKSSKLTPAPNRTQGTTQASSRRRHAVLSAPLPSQPRHYRRLGAPGPLGNDPSIMRELDADQGAAAMKVATT